MVPGQRVLVVENVITTAGTVVEVFDLLASAGAAPAAVAALVVRRGSPFAWEDEVPLVALTRKDIPAFSPDDCPLCCQGTRLVSPGSKYLAETAR
ncbi:phosphoribosyltransferase family protein [Amycolatopsis decaplanina]|uniref:phosphoribosyltransferase family protein n=1 Tax=Amycolatopsis decaplanina TaxID=208441 RepID=UPI003B830EAD